MGFGTVTSHMEGRFAREKFAACWIQLAEEGAVSPTLARPEEVRPHKTQKIKPRFSTGVLILTTTGSASPSLASSVAGSWGIPESLNYAEHISNARVASGVIALGLPHPPGGGGQWGGQA